MSPYTPQSSEGPSCNSIKILGAEYLCIVHLILVLEMMLGIYGSEKRYINAAQDIWRITM